uniref:Glutathione S-transferase n=1 Tax=Glaciozyma antarctica TaxID=105987 RepID=A0A8K1ZF56_9BASI|nr:glutathione S-transferase [Glaciozyma antarctica]
MSSSEQPRYRLIGTPFSTFTRSVALVLEAKGLPYEQLTIAPHSASAQSHHPLGFIPVLYDLRTSTRLSETSAIIAYLERTHPSPPLLVPTPPTILQECVQELMSFAATHLFPKIEFGVVKPRVAAMDEGTASEDEIAESVRGGVEALKPVLRALEGMLGDGPYAVGKRITAADCLLYPPIADLRAVPEGRVLEAFMKISAWSTFFETTEAAGETEEGTLALGARP